MAEAQVDVSYRDSGTSRHDGLEFQGREVQWDLYREVPGGGFVCSS